MITNLPKSIEHIVNELEHTDYVDNNILTEIINHAKFSEDNFIPFQTFNHSNLESYGRKLLVDKGKFKILLMSWRPGDFTAIHNHGFTEWGIVYFFGNAVNRLYENQLKSLSLIQRTSFETGQSASVCGDLIHLMGNYNSKEFTTLHIYGSNTRTKHISQDAEIYVPEKHMKVRTEGSAYLNMSDKFKLQEENYTKYNTETLIDYFNLILPFYTRINRIDMINKIKSYIKNPELFFNQEPQYES